MYIYIYTLYIHKQNWKVIHHCLSRISLTSHGIPLPWLHFFCRHSQATATACEPALRLSWEPRGFFGIDTMKYSGFPHILLVPGHRFAAQVDEIRLLFPAIQYLRSRWTGNSYEEFFYFLGAWETWGFFQISDQNLGILSLVFERKPDDVSGSFRGFYVFGHIKWDT